MSHLEGQGKAEVLGSSCPLCPNTEPHLHISHIHDNQPYPVYESMFFTVANYSSISIALLPLLVFSAECSMPAKTQSDVQACCDICTKLSALTQQMVWWSSG